MMRSMYSGVSGLKNHQTRMDAIGNNIANVNTIGYKGSRVTFQDTLNQTMRGASAPNGGRGGINGLQVGLGMNMASIDILSVQGNQQNTGNTTDMMLSGDGFFVVSDGARRYYTRNGNFKLDSTGTLVSASNGMIVQGWLADERGNLVTNVPATQLRVPLGRTIPPVATTSIEFAGNLNVNTNAYYKYNGETQTITIPYNGGSLTVNAKMTPVPDAFNQFSYDLNPTRDPEHPENDDDSYSIIGNATGVLTLDKDGNVISNTGPTNVTVVAKDGTRFRLQLPETGTAYGSFFTVTPLAATAALEQDIQLGAVAPAFGSNVNLDWDVNVVDSYGNPISLNYAVTDLGNNLYKWTATVNSPPGGEILSGNSGTFTWTAGTGVSDPTGGYMVVESSAGNSIHITPPQLQGGTTPTFRVAEDMPTTLTAPAIGWAAVQGGVPQNFVLTCPLDPEETAGNEVQFTVQISSTDGGTGYRWDIITPPALTPAGTTLVGTTTGGTFTYDGTDLTGVSQNLVTLRTRNGYQFTVAPPIPNTTGDVSLQLVSGTPIIPEFQTPPSQVTMSDVIDSLGVTHHVTFKFEKVGINLWNWVATEGSGLPITNGEGTIRFDTKTGYVTTTPGGPMSFQPVGADRVRVTPDFSKAYQGGGEEDNSKYHWPISDLEYVSQDGYPLGTLEGISVDSAGRIIGVFSNGMNQNLAQVAVATFTNPGGLLRSGDTLFSESSNSGDPRIGQAGIGGRGLIASGALEMSNVDLSQEFTDMIGTQRGFQANSRIITTSDEMLQELVNLKR